ncbi:aminopeptidase N [Agrococcus casei]|uniref:Aminopeptidase N n=1 Tax=Agrococcus casei LMG 22410 TaxID=1255656 RepID=A0A1R4G6F2_9MICO|nr:aminopeptidase N [Agrococcus casei]SJM63778.1 Membrane alanine aminopeptidase N [Agrococcus casei LMG 22410]
MPGENLTRQEASDRAAIVATESYDITLDLTKGDEVFGSTTTVKFTATDGASTFIDHISRTVHSVTLNGVELDPAEVNDGVRIQLPGLAAENELTIVSDAIYMNTGEGLHRFVDPVDGEVYLYSQFEVPDARRVYSVFEQPDLKAEFSFNVVAPARWKVVSNQPTPEPEIDGEVGTWRFEKTPPISSYITALVAGPYKEFRDELTSSDGRTIPLGVFCRESLAEHMDADYIFETTKRGFEFFEQNFDVPYPFDKYDQLFCPEYNMGAMENAGCVTFTEAYIFRSKVTDAIKERRVVTVLHELAHMWFGDLVTMKWWNDLWLNESFAEWSSTLATAEATEWKGAWTTFQALEKTWAYRQDQLPSTHPIVAEIRDLDDVQVNFDGITYAKGGSVIKQLVAWVGIESFMQGLSAYFKKHAWKNTVLADLLVELEAASGRELTEWSKLWLETAGVNTLRPVVETDAEGVIQKLVVQQSAPDDYPTLRPHRIALGFYNRTERGFERAERFEFDIDGAETEIADVVGKQRPEMILLNDDDLAYAKIRLDDQSWQAAWSSVGDIVDPLARALVWGAAWDATRDGEIAARDYVDLVLKHIHAETESTTLRSALAQVAQTARTYVDPSTRAETIRLVGDSLWQLATSAEAGSDAQFQFVTAFAGIASTDEHVAALKALQSGDEKLEGLEIDTDLSWQLLGGLVLNGAAGEAEVDAAHKADNTANGAQAAARVRATVPTAEAKRAAFDAVVDGDVPNMIVRYTGLGLSHVNDPAELATLIERYHSSIDSTWEKRSYQMAEELIQGLYPATAASPELASATREWLAEKERPASLTRLVRELLAGVDRAVAVQQRDAQK